MLSKYMNAWSWSLTCWYQSTPNLTSFCFLGMLVCPCNSQAPWCLPAVWNSNLYSQDKHAVTSPPCSSILLLMKAIVLGSSLSMLRGSLHTFLSYLFIYFIINCPTISLLFIAKWCLYLCSFLSPHGFLGVLVVKSILHYHYFSTLNCLRMVPIFFFSFLPIVFYVQKYLCAYIDDVIVTYFPLLFLPKY